MSCESMLKEWSRQRAELIATVVPRSAVINLGRRTVSGIYWRAGLIITSAEAIAGAERVAVRFSQEELEAQVLATDLSTDIAVLRPLSPSNAQPAASGSSAPQPTSASAAAVASSLGLTPTRTASQAALRVGEPVALVGRTLRGPAAAWGSVQLVGPAWSSRRGGRIDQRLEFDVRFQPELEGAAVLDMDGAVVAMAVPGPRYRVLGIPAETIDPIIAKVEQTGRLPQPYLGIRLQTLWLDEATRTQLGRSSRGIPAVGGVDGGSPAATAHVELGDLLLSLDGEPADNVTVLAQRIARFTPGQSVALEVLRGGRPLTVQIQVGERAGA